MIEARIEMKPRARLRSDSQIEAVFGDFVVVDVHATIFTIVFAQVNVGARHGSDAPRIDSAAAGC